MDGRSIILQPNEVPVTYQISANDSQIMPASDIKRKVDSDYEATNGTSPILWIVLGMTFLLLLIIAIVITIFFLFFNPPAMHEIIINNNCSEYINVLVGVITPNQTLIFFPIQKLNLNQIHYYYATPGTSIIVQGFKNSDTFNEDAVNPFTTVEITFAGEGFGGKHQVTDGDIIITDVHITSNAIDKYGVSVQGGYNIPISLTAKNFVRQSNNDRFYCAGPDWNHTINATGSHVCPTPLQSPGTGTDYQVCLTPCTSIGGEDYCCEESNACSVTGGCEQLWPIKEYYDVFQNACPNCLITNCDDPNYTCRSNSGSLTQYLIQLCP